MATLPALVRRGRALWRRYREDGQLPEGVLQLYTDNARIRAAGLLGRGDPNHVTAGPLATSLDQAAHANASAVVQALAAQRIPVWLVDRRADQLVLGVHLQHRQRAAEALAALAGQPGWALEWRRRHATHTAELSADLPTAGLQRATSWSVYRRWQYGNITVGAGQAVQLTFWTPGPSGQLELVGVRGLERFHADTPDAEQVIDGHRYPGKLAFPVATALERMNAPVDVVYTWVDGADPQWRARFQEWAGRTGRGPTDSALAEGRYRSRDELRYSLRGLHTHCGWVRHIWVVTAGQVPAWLRADDRLSIIDHHQILDSDNLPTFNSHAIESALHRIDGLAERFLYFNDDMFVGRSLRPEAFFTSSGLPLVFPSRARVSAVEGGATLAVDTAAIRGRELLEARYGRVATFKPLHAPYALRRSTMAELEQTFPDEFATTRANRFRAATDISTAASLGLHVGLATGRAVLGELSNDYVHLESPRLQRHLDRLLHDRSFDTFCLNETEQASADPAAVDHAVRRFLDGYFPVASPWEPAASS